MRTCDDMREQMLEAELAELQGSGESALARHVRVCAACRAVAGVLVADTALMRRMAAREIVVPSRAAHEVAVQASRRVRRHAWRPVPLLALPVAAAIVVLFVRTAEPPSGSVADSATPPAGAEVGGVPAAVSSQPASPTVSMVPDAEHPSTRAIEPLVVRPLPAPTVAARSTTAAASGVSAREWAPIADRAPSAHASGWDSYIPPALPRVDEAVRLTPVSGSRAMVMRTRDPAVTVVWLY